MNTREIGMSSYAELLQNAKDFDTFFSTGHEAIRIFGWDVFGKYLLTYDGDYWLFHAVNAIDDWGKSERWYIAMKAWGRNPVAPDKLHAQEAYTRYITKKITKRGSVEAGLNLDI